MKQYNDICKQIIKEGHLATNRTGVSTKTIFGTSIRVDLAKEFPAITCKAAFVRGAIVELNWMLSGSTSVLDLHKHNVSFWDHWAIKGEHWITKSITEVEHEVWRITRDSNIKDMLELDLETICDRYGLKEKVKVDDRFHIQEVSLTNIAARIAYVLETRGFNASTAKEEGSAFVRNMLCGAGVGDQTAEDVAKAAHEKYGDILHTMTEHDLIQVTMDNGHPRNAVTLLRMANVWMTVEDAAKAFGVGLVVAIKTCEVGDLGPIYGHNWRNWKDSQGRKIDQITELVNNLRDNPNSRRHILSFWNPEHLPDERYTPQENVTRGHMALAPCHWMCEFMVSAYDAVELAKKLGEGFEGMRLSELRDAAISRGIAIGKLNIHPHMRSWDFAAGAPVNLVFYGALCHMVAAQTNLDVGELWFTGTDVHMYINQIPVMEDVLARPEIPCGQFRLTEKPDSIFGYSNHCYEMIDYNPHPTARVPVAV